MPNFNNSRFLPEAIASILQQSFKEIELIIIDDESTDGSAKIIKEFSSKDQRIKSIFSKKIGLANILNLGLSIASYPLIARMDSDDVSLLERLQTQFDFMSANPDVAVVGTPTFVVNESGDVLSKSEHPYDSDAVKKKLVVENCVSHPSTMFRKNVILDAGGFNSHAVYAEDYDLWLRVIKLGKIQNLCKPLLKYRHHNQSLSYSNLLDQLISAFIARQLHVYNNDVVDKRIYSEDYSLSYLEYFKKKPVGLEELIQHLKSLAAQHKSIARLKNIDFASFKKAIRTLEEFSIKS